MKKSKPGTDPVDVLVGAAMSVIEAHGIPDEIQVSHDPEGMPTVHIVYEDNSDQSSHSGRGSGHGRIHGLSAVRNAFCGYVFEADRKKKKTVH
jgi:hypothetical protein